MNSIKRPLAFIMVLLLSASLLGCLSTDSGSRPSSPTAAPVADSTMQQAQDAPTADSTLKPMQHYSPLPTAPADLQTLSTPEPTQQAKALTQNEVLLGCYNQNEYRLADIKQILRFDQGNPHFVGMGLNSITLYADEVLDESIMLKPPAGYGKYRELMVWRAAADDHDDTILNITPIFSDDSGWIYEKDTVQSMLTFDETVRYGVLRRPGCAILTQPSTDGHVISRESYALCRILATCNEYSLIITQLGTVGFTKSGQVQAITQEQLLTYAALDYSDGSYNAESFISSLIAAKGKSYPNTESLIFQKLSALGLNFDPVLYLLASNELYNSILYPNPRLYTNRVYNSLAFKLFTTTGQFVTINGEPTQWQYIDSIDDLATGDIVFFSAYDTGVTAIEPVVEVVYRGKYSGHITSVAVFLGDDSLALVENGKVTIQTATMQDMVEMGFDCARRINTTIVDETSYLIECIISNVYSRLGTPYHNLRRVGDTSYDCSGIISWSFRSLGFDMLRPTATELPEQTASSFGNTNLKYRWQDKIVLLDRTSANTGDMNELNELKRGDFVFLLKDTRNRIGHIMIYLGNNFVIHSTNINEEFQGTLVAGFRTELQELYYLTRRLQIR